MKSQTRPFACRAGVFLLGLAALLPRTGTAGATDTDQRRAAPTADQNLQSLAALSPGNRTYYVDSEQGSDQNPGTVPGKPWKTLERVNRVVLAAGDKVLFKAGSAYAGCLKPQGSGQPGAPIIIDSYGQGALPRIDAQGKVPEALLLHNVEHYEINHLELTNLGEERAQGRAGVRVRIKDFGVAHHIHLQKLYVHDVNGALHKGDGDQAAGFGIQWVNGGRRTPSWFEDLRIEGCRLVRTDRNGICGSSEYWQRTRWHPSRNVVISHNLLEDIGGDGIVPLGCDGCLVEHNVLRGGRMRAPDKCAGLWPWSCDHTLFQFNEVSGMKGDLDGQGFDSDYNCANTVFQYNFSHDNDGGFMLICNNGGLKAPQSVGTVGTIVRYNISQNDGTRLFHFGGPCRDTHIYNNVFYVGKKRDIIGILQEDWGGWPQGTRFENNIFYVEGKVEDKFAGAEPPVFRHNVFFGNYVTPPPDPQAITSDPMLVSPGSGGSGFASLDGYRLKAASPCLGAGVVIPDNGGRDFWGHPVPAAQAPAIGIYQP